jgi:hypothetical protein
MAIQITSNDPRVEAASRAIAAQRQLRAASGAVDALRRNVGAMQTGMLSSLVTLATGGSKLEAVFAGIGTALTVKILGPMGLFAGMSYAVLKSVQGLARGFGEMGVRGAAGMETVMTQLRTLLKGMESARERVRSLREFADFTPFGFKDVAAGDKTLQSFTRGALNTEAGLSLVGDAAAVAGTQFSQMAGYVSEAYAGLASGRPIGAALAELQRLGVITGQTRNALESMQASGTGFTDMWRVLESDLKRSRGAMQNMSRTLEGMESTFEDAKSTMEAGFGEGFLDGEKRAVQSMTQAVERLTPVTDYYGRLLGRLTGLQSNFSAKVMDAATDIPGMETALKGVGTAFLALNAAILGNVLFKGLGKGIGAAMGAMKGAGQQVTKGAGGYTVASGTAVKDRIRNDLSAAGKAGGMAFQLALAGAMGQAFSAVLNGFGKLVSAFRAGGLTASVMLLGGAFRVLGAAARGVGAALVANPITLTLAAAATVGWLVYDAWSQAQKAVEGYAAATDDILGRLRSQAAGIQTLQDLSRVYAETVRELGAAHEAANRAALDGNSAMESAARGRIASLKVQQMELEKLSRASLRRPDEQYERQGARREDERSAAFTRRETQQEIMGGEARLKDLQTQRKEIEEQARAAKSLYDGLQQVQEAQAAAGDSAQAAGTKLVELQGKMVLLKAEAEKYRPENYDLAGDAMGFAGSMPDNSEEKLRAAEAAIKKLQQELENTEEEAQQVGQSLRVALQSSNELAILKAKINVYNAYAAAAENANAARTKLLDTEKREGATESDRAQASSDFINAERDAKVFERIAGNAGVTVGPEGANALAEMQQQVREMEALASEREKIARLAAQDRAIAMQTLEVWRARRELELQVAEEIAAAGDNAYQAELKRLDLARERLQLDREEAERKARLIEEEGRSRAAGLRRAGQGGEAATVEQASKSAAEATRQQARAESDRRQQALDASRAAMERDAARQREQSRAGVEAGEMDVEAVRQRRGGNLAGAHALEESAARRRDEAERPMLERALRDQGMSGPEAAATADRDLESRRRRREEDRREESRQAGFAQSESSGRNAAEGMRTRALEAEMQGHLDYAEELREAAAQTERASTFQQRVADMMQREGISREQAEAKVKKGDEEDQKQRQMEMDQRKKKRDMAKEGVKSENKARRADMSGNEERAARIREKQAQKEREQALKEQGWAAKEAAEQARRERRDARRERRSNQTVEVQEIRPDLRMTASTMRRVGGGGSAYGAGSHAPRDLFSRLDKITKHLQAMHQQSAASRNLFSARLRI